MDNKAFTPNPDELSCQHGLRFEEIKSPDPPLSSGGVGKDVDAKVKVGLKRQLGLGSGIGLIVGIIIGSGIFVSPGGLLERTGSVGLCLCVWSACGVLSALGAMIYIELGTVVPSSGAEYAYLHAAFGPIPAFLFSWISTIILKPSSLAILCMTFAQYSIGPFLPLVGSNSLLMQDDPYLKLSQKLVCTGAIMLVTYINCSSVSLAMRVQNYLTGAKLLAIGIIICAGIYNIIVGRVGILSTGFEGSRWEYGALASSFYNGLWAFDGWNSLNYVTEELENPYRNLPLAILIGLPLVTVSYILVNISYFTVASFTEIVQSPVAILFGDRMLGKVSWLMPLAVAVSTFATANGSQFTAGRLGYVASRKGHLVESLCYIDAKRSTPSPAMIFNASLAVLMTVFLDIEGLIDFFSFTAWIFYGGAVGAAICLRFSRPDAPRPFKVPILVPVFVLLVSIFLVIAPILDSPKVQYLYVLGFLIFGLVLYVPFCHYKLILPGLRNVNHFLQLLLQVVPPEGGMDSLNNSAQPPIHNGQRKKLT